MSQSFFNRRSFAIIIVAVFLMPFMTRGTRLALESNRNDVRDWLPSDFPETTVHRWFQQHFPHEQFVLVSWKGATPDDPGCTLHDPRLETLARKLETFDPSLEELGITGSLGKLLAANHLDTRHAIDQYDDLKSIEGISPKQAAEVARKIGAWVSPFKSPVLTGPRLAKMLKDRYEDLDDEEVLTRLEGSLIGPDHEKTCLVVTLSGAAKGKKLRGTLGTIRRLARECAVRDDDIRMGGPPVDNVAIDIEGEKTLFRLAGLSAIVGLVISWLCFRNFRLTFLVFFVAVLAAGIGLASVYYTGLFSRLFGMEEIASRYGTVDAILLSMPSLVYVLAISGAIHIINYYHDAVREHGLPGALDRALKHGWVPCTLAAITTALGLGSLMASHLIPINKFGIYSAWGVLATLSLLFLFMPACLHFFPSREYVAGGAKNLTGRQEATVIVRFWRRVGRFVIAHNGWITAGCMAVMVFFIVGLTQIHTSIKLMKLFSPEAEIISHYAWLEDHIGPLVPMEVVIHIDNEKCKLSFAERMRLAKRVERAVESLDEVGGALSAATFAAKIPPSNSPPGTVPSVIERIRDRRTSVALERHRKEFREYLTVDGDATLEELGISDDIAKRLKSRKLESLEQIEQYLADKTTVRTLESIRGIGPEEADEVNQAIRAWQSEHGVELWRISARVRALSDVDYGEFAKDLQAKVEPVLQAYVKAGWEGIGRRPDSGANIPGANAPDSDTPELLATYTGLVPLVYKAQRELMTGLYNSLKLAFVLIGLVMIMVLRSPTAGLLSMIPNLFPVVLIFGAMGWMGILAEIGTMMTASVALGVAVDDTIHFLTWFRRGLDEGRDRKSAVMLAYERCGTAMTQTTLIGGLGLSAFAFSTFTPTQRFGVLMLALLTAALFGDLIFLPAVLSGPIGRFFRASKKKQKPRQGPEPSADSARQPDEELVTTPISAAPSTSGARRNVLHRRTKAS